MLCGPLPLCPPFVFRKINEEIMSCYPLYYDGYVAYYQQPCFYAPPQHHPGEAYYVYPFPHPQHPQQLQQLQLLHGNGAYYGPSFGRIDPSTGHDYRRLEDGGRKVDESRVHDILARRLRLKINRNFAEADRLRDELGEMGVMVHDREKTWEVRRRRRN